MEDQELTTVEPGSDGGSTIKGLTDDGPTDEGPTDESPTDGGPTDGRSGEPDCGLSDTPALTLITSIFI